MIVGRVVRSSGCGTIIRLEVSKCECRYTNAPLDELAEAGQRPVGELGDLGVALVDLHLLVVQPIQRHRLFFVCVPCACVGKSVK